MNNLLGWALNSVQILFCIAAAGKLAAFIYNRGTRNLLTSVGEDESSSLHSPDDRLAAARFRTSWDVANGQTCALMPTAFSRMRFIAFAQSSAVFVSSNTSVNAGDDSACPTKNPGSSGAPSSDRKSVV